MKKIILMTAFFMLVINVHAVNPHVSISKVHAIRANTMEQVVVQLNSDEVIHLNRKGIERSIGRKLSLKERFVLRWIKRKLKQNANMSPSKALEETKIDNFSIAGFVLGILGLLFLPYSVVFAIVGIFFSIIALKRIKKEPERRRGRTFALAGLILSIIGAVVGLVVGAIIFIFLFM